MKIKAQLPVPEEAASGSERSFPHDIVACITGPDSISGLEGEEVLLEYLVLYESYMQYIY